MGEHTIYVRIDGEPFLSAARRYRDERYAVREAWQALAKEFGADEIPGEMHGLIFHSRDNVPKGWSKPDRKGFSKPKKGSDDEARLRNMPRLPRSYDVFGKTLIFDISYSGPDSWGSGAIGGFFFGPTIGWCNDTFFACLPDAAAAAVEHLNEHPTHKITNGADNWSLPDGLTRITKAEMELAFAQHAVEQERSRAESAALGTSNLSQGE